MKSKTVAGLIAQIPENLLSRLSESHEVDHSVSRLYGRVMFKLLIYGMLRSERLSTHALEDLYNSSLFSVFSGKGGHKTRHSSLASRLNKLPYAYFESIFEWVRDHFSAQIKTHPKWLSKLSRFDSSMIAIGGGLVDWGMRVGAKPKDGHPTVQLKVSLGLKGLFPSTVAVFREQKYLAEERALKVSIESAMAQNNSLLTFDQGLKKRTTLKSFDEQSLRFVTRASASLRYQKIETYKHIKGRKADGLRFIQDSKVYLYASGDHVFEYPFRLIEAEVINPKEGQDKKIYFLTNIWDLSAMRIAQIYRHRWDIEVFFRFLKQELNLNHLINHSLNGIMIQIYASLITAILLIAFKNINNIKGYRRTKIRFEDQLIFSIVEDLQKMSDSIKKIYKLGP